MGKKIITPEELKALQGIKDDQTFWDAFDQRVKEVDLLLQEILGAAYPERKEGENVNNNNVV